MSRPSRRRCTAASRSPSRRRHRPRRRHHPSRSQPHPHRWDGSAASPRASDSARGDAMHDLSIVTDTLRKILTDALAISPIWGGGPPPFSVNVSGQHPETPSGGADCELSLYLFHVGMDKFLANSFWSQAAQHGGKAPIAFEPLSLDLWYMLSAQSQASYVHEQ